MKLKTKVYIKGGWKRERIFLDVIETTWMTFVPLFCGIMFGLSHNLPWLLLGVMPIFIKFVYERDGEKTIYLR